MKEDFSFNGATFDSRLVRPGMLYIALKGANADGNDYIPQALAAGAARVIGGPNALEEVQELANAYRHSLTGVTVVALTGSAGKTTTKEFLRAFLSTAGKTHATEGNFNNHLGLPVTILNCPRDARFLVVEMGSNHPGEIAALCDIAAPDCGLITNIGSAHMEFFGSREGIAREKGALAARVRDFAVFPPACDYRGILRAMCKVESIDAAELDEEFAAAVSNVIPGEHNLSNAAVAFSLAQRLGVTRESAMASLADFKLPGSRWRKRQKDGVEFIDDTYNANPDAMKAALKALSNIPSRGRRVAVLGDMYELGEMSEQMHREVFDYAASLGIDAVFAVGAVAGRCNCTRAFVSVEECALCRHEIFNDGDLVLLKASNAMKLGKLAE